MMNIIIRSVLFIMFLILAKPGTCQHDTIFFTGVNGRLVTEDMADTRKEIKYRSSSKIDILTYRLLENKWKETMNEQISRVGENKFRIKNKDDKKSRLLIRNYEHQIDGSYLFSEYTGQKLVRTGRTLRQFPIILDGESVDYYTNGQVKSKSVFKNNELISNRNWLENGEKYIDSIFYSVDEEPTLRGGNALFHQHVMQAFKDTGLDFSSVSGNLLLGFVVMETGDLTGIRVMKSLSSQIDGIAVKALQTLNGIWFPGKLNGEEVRYFQLFPINFILKQSTFQYMEFNGYMMFYDAETHQ